MIEKTKREAMLLHSRKTLIRLLGLVKANPDLTDSFVTLAIEYNNCGHIDLEAVGFKLRDDVDVTKHLNVHKQLKRFFNDT